MSRKEAVERMTLGVVYLPIYHLVLYPLVFFAGLFASVLTLAWQALTGRRIDAQTEWTRRAWKGISDPVSWVYSGREADKPDWMP